MGTVTDASFRFRTAEGWCRRAVRFLNLVGQADVGAFVWVLDDSEAVAGVDEPFEVAPHDESSPPPGSSTSSTTMPASFASTAWSSRSTECRGPNSSARARWRASHPGDIGACMEMGLAVVSVPGSVQTLLHRLCRADGLVLWVEATMISEPTHGTVPVLVIHDVTERRTRQAALAAREEGLRVSREEAVRWRRSSACSPRKSPPASSGSTPADLSSSATGDGSSCRRCAVRSGVGRSGVG